MGRWDYFSAARERWRADALMRAQRLLVDRPGDAADYAEKRIGLSRFGTFERRRWKYIRQVLQRESAGGPR